jgi:hypothetical protein
VLDGENCGSAKEVKAPNATDFSALVEVPDGFAVLGADLGQLCVHGAVQALTSQSICSRITAGPPAR